MRAPSGGSPRPGPLGPDSLLDFQNHVSDRYSVGASLVRSGIMRCWNVGVLEVKLGTVTNCRYQARMKSSLGFYYGIFFPHL